MAEEGRVVRLWGGGGGEMLVSRGAGAGEHR